MSIAIAHFGVGATLATVALLYFVPWAPYPRVIVLLSGVWGMIPDGYRILPVYAARMNAFHESLWANAFWFHQRLDVIDHDNSIAFATASLGAFILVTFIAERWEYTVAEQRDGGATGVSRVRSLAVFRSALGVLGIGYGALLFGLALVTDSYTVLYVGVGTALGILGLAGLTDRSARSGRDTPWERLPRPILVTVQIAIAFGALTIASGLVTSLRTAGTLDPVYVGVALLLLLLVSLLAGTWIATPTTPHA